jgi:hypothetical protein
MSSATIKAPTSLPELWEVHAKTLSVEQVETQSELEHQIQTFYEKVVSDGLKGSPLNDDELGIIASFLVPAPGTITLKEGEPFGFVHGIGMVATVNRNLTMQCLIAEMKRHILDKAATGASMIEFSAKRDSRFFREWMSMRNLKHTSMVWYVCDEELIKRISAQIGYTIGYTMKAGGMHKDVRLAVDVSKYVTYIQ